ncbi:MAG: hypothetical protein RR063_09485 [Anaerovoracaceae bacterium]
MSIDSKKFGERHRKFENKISDDTYKSLEKLYNIVARQEISSAKLSLLKKMPEYKQSPDDKMKTAIYYTRSCLMIESLLEEYKQYDDEVVKNVIDYYINSNCMQELNNIGLGWYYDVKYKKNTATLYSVGYGNDSNWIEWLQNKNVENNQIKENGIQLVFTACKEHINRGGRIRLKSLSKCFGVDLFKYMQLDNNCNANLYIIKDAPVNFIKNNDKEISLQEYLLSDDIFDVDNKPQFCLDFSHPRNEKVENYNNWSNRFLQDSKYISQAEINEKKKNYGIESEQEDFLLELLKQEHIQDGEKGISSRISPIADKEVIASDTLWSIENYNINLKEDDILAGKCYHFTFNSTEYCQLIFDYFKMYAEKHSKSFKKNYNLVIGNILLSLEEEQKKFENLSGEQLQNEEIEKMKQQCDYNKNLIRNYSSYEEFLKNITIEETPIKMKLALSFIDWNLEKIPPNWSINNIYTAKSNKEENLKINLYKCICKRVALKGD